jgi:hypothetical protein
MITAITTSIPPGEFEEVSTHMPDWQARFLKLVQEGKRIKYGLYTMPNIPTNIQSELSRRSYSQLILDEDNWQHFLIPQAL